MEPTHMTTTTPTTRSLFNPCPLLASAIAKQRKQLWKTDEGRLAWYRIAKAACGFLPKEQPVEAVVLFAIERAAKENIG